MTSIGTRPCGPAKEPVPVLSFGSFFTWERSVFEDVVALLRRAVAAGGLMVDVAVYRADFLGAGSSDRDSPTDLILARALQVAGIPRSEYVLGAKAWFPPTQQISLSQQIDELLLRQGTDHADHMIVESIDHPDAFDMRAVVAEIGRIIASGRVHYWAVNNWSVAQVRHAFATAAELGVPVPQFGQMKYGLAHRVVVESPAFEALCDETGFSVQATRVLGGGLLMGTGEGRLANGRTDWLGQRSRELAGRLEEVARGFDASPAQFAVAFALTNARVANVLLGVRTLAQFEDVLGGLDLLGRVPVEDLRRAADEFWIDCGRIDPDSGGGPGSEL